MIDYELAARIDHTLLKPEATRADILRACAEGRALRAASVCVNSCWAAAAAQALAGSGVRTCCVVGFPLGAMAAEAKAFEARAAVAAGAQEIDMVMNVGLARGDEWDAVQADIAAVVAAAAPAPVKVILETCLLTDGQKRRACLAAKAAGAAFVKTSTGFSTGGATFHDIELFAKHVAGRCKIKAAGGISTVEDMEKFLALGADRLGTSRAVKILNGEQAKGY